MKTLGATAPTERVSLVSEAPQLLEAFTVYSVCAQLALSGRPVISQVRVLKLSPDGSAGEMEQLVTAAAWPFLLVTLMAASLYACTFTAAGYVMSGQASVTLMVQVVLVDPEASVAVMVCATAALATEGLPLMVPVWVSRRRPLGRGGSTLYTSVSEVPLLKSAFSLTKPPTSGVREHDPPSYVSPVGAAEITSRLCLNVTVFTEFEAVMVYSALPAEALGVPEMTPVAVSMERPAGSEGDTE
jgi:hypothetical protein